MKGDASHPDRVTVREFDTAGRVIREVNPAGGETTYEYGDLSKLVRTVDPEGVATETCEDLNNPLVTYTTVGADVGQAPCTPGNGTITEQTQVDYRGRTHISWDGDPTEDGTLKAEYGYDAAGRVQSVSEGSATAFCGIGSRGGSDDGLGRQTHTVVDRDANGSYDPASPGEFDPEDYVVETTYTPGGRERKRIEPPHDTDNFDWDQADPAWKLETEFHYGFDPEHPELHGRPAVWADRRVGDDPDRIRTGWPGRPRDRCLWRDHDLWLRQLREPRDGHDAVAGGGWVHGDPNHRHRPRHGPGALGDHPGAGPSSGPNDSVVSYGYNPFGEVESVTDANGVQTNLAYDARRQIASRNASRSLITPRVMRGGWRRTGTTTGQAVCVSSRRSTSRVCPTDPAAWWGATPRLGGSATATTARAGWPRPPRASSIRGRWARTRWCRCRTRLVPLGSRIGHRGRWRLAPTPTQRRVR
ncbi:MAG: hypothetical protein U5R31_16725 [Acidimicrobiia bacterium]|nr:hypothetical protein [Acidimicrobiia bacterium]